MEYQDIIISEFNYRKGANSAYSLRSFARDLGLSPSRLSEIMSRKGELSPSSAGLIALKLGLKNKEINVFKSLVTLKSKIAGESDKKIALEILGQSDHAESFRMIDDSTFSLIAEPEHIEILVAMELDQYDGSSAFLSHNLKMSIEHVDACIERLQKAGLVIKSQNHYLPNSGYITTTQDVPSKALRLSHKLTLKKAMDSLDEVSIELRDITSMTMAIDVDKIPEAKELIKDFRRNLSKLLSKDQKKNQVYNLNVQLYPISRTHP